MYSHNRYKHIWMFKFNKKTGGREIPIFLEGLRPSGDCKTLCDLQGQWYDANNKHPEQPFWKQCIGWNLFMQSI